MMPVASPSEPGDKIYLSVARATQQDLRNGVTDVRPQLPAQSASIDFRPGDRQQKWCACRHWW
jgi:hypothetical protein